MCIYLLHQTSHPPTIIKLLALHSFMMWSTENTHCDSCPFVGLQDEIGNFTYTSKCKSVQVNSKNT